MIIRTIIHVVGKIFHTGRDRTFLIVRVAIVFAVAELLHQSRRRVAEMHGHFHGPEVLRVFQR